MDVWTHERLCGNDIAACLVKLRNPSEDAIQADVQQRMLALGDTMHLIMVYDMDHCSAIESAVAMYMAALFSVSPGVPNIVITGATAEHRISFLDTINYYFARTSKPEYVHDFLDRELREMRGPFGCAKATEGAGLPRNGRGLSGSHIIILDGSSLSEHDIIYHVKPLLNERSSKLFILGEGGDMRPGSPFSELLSAKSLVTGLPLYNVATIDTLGG